MPWRVEISEKAIILSPDELREEAAQALLSVVDMANPSQSWSHWREPISGSIVYTGDGRFPSELAPLIEVAKYG